MAKSRQLTGRIARGWLGHLWHEIFIESRRPVAPPFTAPEPQLWDDNRLTAAWLGHSTVLVNFYGIRIVTDPVLFPRIGIRLPGFSLGPKRLTAPALRVDQLPLIDLVLLSHAHFDHLDTRTLHCFGKSTSVITATRTRDLLRWMRFGDVTELHWGESSEVRRPAGVLRVQALRVNHWGARLRRDLYRGYNGYLIERKNHRIIFAGDTALTEAFRQLRDQRGVDLAIFSIGCYNPWIRSHCTPEQAVQMANDAGAEFIMPVHHQTFRLSAEPFREPIERFERALDHAAHRIALREIGQTFVLPL
ncbi:MAG: MBL fold metallo-hydrolase [Chthoniobacterales bacterium]